MNSSILAAAAVLVCCSPAVAGRNSGGAMIVHTDDYYEYSAATACSPPDGFPAGCAEASTTTTRHVRAVVWLLAAFHESADPAVTTVYFGIDYDTANLDPEAGFRPCTNDVVGNPPVQIYDPGWPLTGFGCTVGWVEPITDRVFPFYVFRIDGGTTGSYFGTGPNPTGGYAAFVDDHSPPITDECTRFGQVRWYEPGGNECPGLPVPGACCFPDARCAIFTYQNLCEDAGGIYQGDGTTCDAPCGACCYWIFDAVRRCVVTTESDCYDDTRWDNIKVWFGDMGVGSYWTDAGMPCSDDPMQPGWFCYPFEYEWEGGACCLENGDCAYSAEHECEVFGRVFLGRGTACDLEACRERWSGACCFADGSCLALPGNECSAAFQGPGSTCDPNPCRLPHVQRMSWGALKTLFR